MTNFYVTTFCNFAHNVKTGRPLGHECYVLPPAALRAEMAGDYEKAGELIQAARTRIQVRGRTAR